MAGSRRDSQRNFQRRRARMIGDYEQAWAEEKLSASAGEPSRGPDIPHGTDEESERTTREKDRAQSGHDTDTGERRNEMRLEGDAAVTRDTQDSANAPVKKSGR